MTDRLTIGDVERIATLARLALTHDEKSLYAGQLTRILEYASQVAELDTDRTMMSRRDVAATGEIPGSGPVLPSGERADEARSSLERAEALANAPDGANGLFRVPKVLGDA